MAYDCNRFHSRHNGTLIFLIHCNTLFNFSRKLRGYYKHITRDAYFVKIVAEKYASIVELI